MPIRARRRRVLVLDDDPDIVYTIATTLEEFLPDVEVLQAGHPQEALELMHSQSVDVVIVDYRLPAMDGIEFLKTAKRLSPQAPRIMLTAYPDLDLAIRAINEGRVHHFLNKPIAHTELLDIVDQALQERYAFAERSRRFAARLAAARESMQERRPARPVRPEPRERDPQND